MTVQRPGNGVEQIYLIGPEGSLDGAVQALADAGTPCSVSRYLDWPSWLCVATDVQPGCVLLHAEEADGDADGDGDSLLRRLAAIGDRHATIVLTDDDRVAVAVAAMRAGAADLLRKPVAPPDLARAIHAALAQLARRAGRRVIADEARAKVERLTSPERDVMAAMVAGLTDAEIGDRLRLDVGTAAMYRASLLTKTGSAGTVDLMRCAIAAGMLTDD